MHPPLIGDRLERGITGTMAQEPTTSPAAVFPVDPVARGYAECRRWALFLDLDGTLLDIAEAPDAVRIDQALRQRLTDLALALGGALAIVSGRPVNDVDHLLALPNLAVVGLHGLEHRDTAGHLRRLPAPPGLEPLGARLRHFAERWPGVLIEDKGATLALHYRRTPAAAVPAREFVHDLVAGRTDLVVLEGKMVFEIKPGHADKGAAIASLMAAPPFAGRIPVFVGDDTTDEDGFAMVNRLGGISIRVGDRSPSHAPWKLENVEAVHVWLDRLVATLASTADPVS